MAQPVTDPLALADAFDVRRGEMIALTGAGGKSGLMFAFGRIVPPLGFRVLLTTTTRLWAWQQNLARVACCWPLPLSRLQTVLDEARSCLVTAGPRHDKAHGLPPKLVDRLHGALDVEYMVVEADGARGYALKAPAPHEPVVPDRATLVIVVLGVQAIGRRLVDVAFRPARVSAISGIAARDRVSAEACARVLTSSRGGLAGVPASARVALFVNQVSTSDHLASARCVAQEALRIAHIDRVVAGNTRLPYPVVAVWR